MLAARSHDPPCAGGKVMVGIAQLYYYLSHQRSYQPRSSAHLACAANHTVPTPTLCSFQGIDSGHRQLIAVTCIAEHA